MRPTRRIAAATAALLLGVAASACGDDGNGDGSASVTMWMYPVIGDQDASQQFWSEVETGFEETNEGIDLTIELQPWDGRQETITTALASGTGFDIVLLGPDQIPQYVEQGSLQPVGDLVGDAVDAFLPGAVEALSVDADLYGVPMYHTVVTPLYNRAAFAEAGIDTPPATWDDVRAATDALVEAGYTVYDYPGSPEETLNLTFYPLLWQAGGDVFAADGQSVAFDGPEGLAALEFLAELSAAGGLAADAPSLGGALDGRPFAAGEAAIMHISDLATARTLAESLGEDIVPIPPLAGAEPATFGLPGGLAVSHAAEDTDAVGAVLSYLASAETAEGLSGASGFFPARTDVEMPDDGPFVDVFAAALPHAYAGDTHPQARQVMAIVAPQVQAVLLGDKEPEQALADAAAEANALLGA